MMGISVAIMTGGRSRRMGSDKALLKCEDSRTYLERICDEMSVFSHKYLSVNEYEDYASINEYIRVVDENDDIGPLGGLCALLSKIETEAVLILAVDMPKYTIAEATEICSRYRGEDILIANDGTRLQPLAAIYNKRILPIVKEQIARKEYGMMKLYEKVAGVGGDVGVFESGHTECYVNRNTVLT